MAIRPSQTPRSCIGQDGARQSAADKIAIARHRDGPERLPREWMQTILIYQFARARGRFCSDRGEDEAICGYPRSKLPLVALGKIVRIERYPR
jgi:hypothetical protein